MFQQVRNNKKATFCQVKQGCALLSNALLKETLFLLVLLLLASSKAIAQEIESGKIIPEGYNSMIRPGNPIEGSK